MADTRSLAQLGASTSDASRLAARGKTQMCFALLLSAALPTTYGDRRLSVAKSPSMPPLSFSFAITASGLVPLTAGGEVPTL
eukprot:jgi/Pico_ML_1/53519/g4053.t2